jgi:hypothetical protein
VDVVLYGLAPNFTGISVSDQAKTLELAEVAPGFRAVAPEIAGRVPGEDLPGRWV